MLNPAPGQPLADSIAKTVRGMDPAVPLEFIRHLGDDDVFHRGPRPGGTVIVLPGIWTGMPPDLLAAVRARRRCSATGRCPVCGSCLELATGTYHHEPECPVSDDALAPALRRWARRVGLVRGRRIEELPA